MNNESNLEPYVKLLKSEDKADKEFDRGYNFGYKQGTNDLMTKIVKAGGRYREEYETDSVLVAIPKEYFQHIEEEAKRTA